nr:glycerophosphodiester phosphodiesterase family protein [Auritidibacter ignavus]
MTRAREISVVSVPDRHRDRPLVVGHRGASLLAPENSLLALRAGLNAGADAVEIDVQLSADGVPVVFHDRLLQRTTNIDEVFPERHHLTLSSFSYEELSQLQLRGPQGLSGERIPTLDQVPQVLGDHAQLFVEVKEPAHSPGIIQLLIGRLTQDPVFSSLVAQHRLRCISFDHATIRDVVAGVPGLHGQYLVDQPPSRHVVIDAARHCLSMGTNHRTLDAATVRAVHEHGMALSVYTVNTVADVQRVTELGVDVITTDDPGLVPSGS